MASSGYKKPKADDTYKNNNRKSEDKTLGIQCMALFPAYAQDTLNQRDKGARDLAPWLL